MAYLLESKFGFQKQNMRILLDDTQDHSRRPTRANMLDAIGWLISGSQPGDSLFFHYSGKIMLIFCSHSTNFLLMPFNGESMVGVTSNDLRTVMTWDQIDHPCWSFELREAVSSSRTQKGAKVKAHGGL